MVHTFVIIKNIEHAMADRLIARYPDGENRISKTDKTNPIGMPGVVRLFVKKGRNKHGRFAFVKVEFEPQTLLDRQSTVDLYQCSKQALRSLLGDMENALKTILNDEVFASLSGWLLQRIDYAVNIETNYVEQYIILMKRAKTTKYFKDKDTRAGSLYLKSKTVHINFYNKQDEIRKRLNGDPDFYNLIGASENILRLEIQCRNGNKITRIANKYRIESKEDLEAFLDPRIARETICFYYKSFIGEGDFYSSYHGAKLIDKRFTQSKKKCALKEVRALIASRRSIQKAKEWYATDGGTLTGMAEIDRQRKRFDDHCRDLNKKGLNPIPIPKNWNIRVLPSLIPDMYRATRDRDFCRAYRTYRRIKGIYSIQDRNV